MIIMMIITMIMIMIIIMIMIMMIIIGETFQKFQELKKTMSTYRVSTFFPNKKLEKFIVYL